MRAMKVSQALQIGQIMDGKKIPSDMQDEHLVYYSSSRERWINIMDMEVCHLVRAFNKNYTQDNHVDDQQYINNNLLSQAFQELDDDTVDKILAIVKQVKNESSR